MVVLGDHHKLNMKERHQKSYAVASLLTHPAYDKNSFNADIALITLKQRVTYSRAIRPVCLPTKGEYYKQLLFVQLKACDNNI